MGNQKSKQTTKSVQNTDQKTVTPGTSFGTALLPRVEPLLDQNSQTQAFTGNRVAGPTSQDQYVAQWGAAPDTFVPQSTQTSEALRAPITATPLQAGRTAAQQQASITATPQQANVTHVDPNVTEEVAPRYVAGLSGGQQQGIDQGLATATDNAGRLSPITNNLFDYWAGIAGGGGSNPNLQAVLDAFTTDFNERSAVAQSQRALNEGVDGGFGSGYAQTQAWSAEQEAQAYARQVAQLRYQDFLNTQGLMQAAPMQLSGLTDITQQPAEQMIRYGNLQQQGAQADINNNLGRIAAETRNKDAEQKNLVAAAQAGDKNAQIALDNLWNQQKTFDTNQQIEKNNQFSTAQLADTNAQIGAENLYATQGVADANAQAGNFNQWQQAGLVDTNASNAAAEALAQWNAQYQIDEAAQANQNQAALVQQGQTQAGYDNAFLQWLNQQETLNNQFANVGNAAQIAATIPGSQTTGHATMDSTTTQTQQAAPWQVAAGIGGGLLQAFAPGGMFAGSLKALGGAGGGLLPMPAPVRLPALGG